jgi:N-formylglutamate deformylase
MDDRVQLGALIEPVLLPGVLEVRPPSGDALPLVMDSPHSGAQYPEDFEHSISRTHLRSLEDAFVDELFHDSPRHGATFLRALFPRSYIDPNRAHDDLDSRMLSDSWPHASNPGPKSDSGIGLIFRYASQGPIYRRKLAAAEVRRRLDGYYWPYHNTLERILDRKWEHFGEVFHVNCHSMKSISPAAAPEGSGVSRPDFVVGDRDGSSCEGAFTRLVCEYLCDHGHRVSVNDPYKGVELVRRYADPSSGRNSLQIEIKRALYMDERDLRKHEGFEVIAGLMQGLTQELARFVGAR